MLTTDCAKKLRFNVGLSCEKSEVFVTSQWQRDLKPSVKYLIYRWTFASYFVFIQIVSLVTSGLCKHLSFYAIYMTNWNVILNVTSSVFGAVLVTFYHQGMIKFSDDDNKKMSIVFKCYWILTSISTTISISISFVYWTFIYEGPEKGLSDVLTHAGNAIVMFIDIFINAHPPRFGHFVYPTGLGILYGVLFVIPYVLLGGTDKYYNSYIYKVLDWNENPTGALIFTLATIIFITCVHFIMTFMGISRMHLHKLIGSKDAGKSGNQEGSDNQGFNA